MTSAARTQPILDVRGLSVEFKTPAGAFFPVDGVSFSVERGGLLCLVGESGSGKSTAARAVMGLLPEGARIAAGSVRFDGVETSALGERSMRGIRGRRIGMIFQEPMTALNPMMTAGAQIREAMTAHGMTGAEAESRVVRLLEEAGVVDARRVAGSHPHQLSGGLRQRVLIAIALACGPDLIIADEPTSALDMPVSHKIIGLLLDLRRSRGTAVLLITHDFGFARAAGGGVAVMYAGRLLEMGPAADVLERPRHPYTAALMGSLPGRSSASAGRRLQAIPGQAPLPGELTRGCAFRPRCGRSVPGCELRIPGLKEECGRLVRCMNPV
jgi:oligopeptide/dipeptide ABC transporter ATP-binding protein